MAFADTLLDEVSVVRASGAGNANAVLIEAVSGGVSFVFAECPDDRCVIRRSADGLYQVSFGKCVALGKSLRWTMEQFGQKSAICSAVSELLKPYLGRRLTWEDTAQWQLYLERIYSQFRQY